MAILKTAYLEFRDPNHNHSLVVDPMLSDDAIVQKYLYTLKEVPNLGPDNHRQCIGVKVTTKEVTPVNQAEFEGFFNIYCYDLLKKGVHPFCSDIHALSTWVSKYIHQHSCAWEFGHGKVTDMYGTELSVGIIEGERFVLFRMTDTKLFNKLGQKVCGLNNGEYGRSRPEKVKGNSFYNNCNQLVFWNDEDQKKQLEEKMQYEIDWTNAWAEYNKVKDQRNEETFIPVMDIVAMHMMESVPPVRFDRGRFLAGEAAYHNSKGQAVYQEFRKIDNKEPMWESKYSSIEQYTNRK